MFEIGDLRSRPITGEHDLFVTIEEGIEGVEKFLLRPLFSGEKLNVVDQDQVCLSVTFPEFDQGIVLDGSALSTGGASNSSPSSDSVELKKRTVRGAPTALTIADCNAVM